MRYIRTILIAVGMMLLIAGCAQTTEDKISAQLALGQKYLLEQDYEQAIVAFNKIIELDPRQIEAYEGLMDAYTATADYSNALTTYQNGLQYLDEMVEEQAAYLDYLGLIAEGVRDYEIDSSEAAAQKVAWASEIIAYDPGVIAAYEGQIDGYLYQGDVDSAYESYQDAEEADNGERTEELEDEKEQIEAATKEQYDNEEDLDKKSQLIERLIDLDPDNAEYPSELEQIHEEQERLLEEQERIREEEEQARAMEEFVSGNVEAFDYLLATCESRDDDAIIALYYSEEYAAIYWTFPDTLSSYALEENGTTLLLFRESSDDRGLYIYYGEVHDGVASGEGNVYVALTADNRVIGSLADLSGTPEFGRYAIYKGHWANGLPNGQGTYVEYEYQNHISETVTGNYTDGLENGNMTHVYDNESVHWTFHYTADMGYLHSIGTALLLSRDETVEIAARSEEVDKMYCGILQTSRFAQGVLPFSSLGVSIRETFEIWVDY